MTAAKPGWDCSSLCSLACCLRRESSSRPLNDFHCRLKLDEVSRDLVTVVRSTLQPAKASLWMRTETRT